MVRKDRDIARLIRLSISQIDPCAEVILFGSRARGDAREKSDWDVLILTDNETDLKREGVFRDHLYELELQTGESFSVFAYSKKDWHGKQRITPFYNNVTRKGIVL